MVIRVASQTKISRMADTSPLPTIERGAAVGADVEVLGVPLDGLHNLSRAGAAVHTGAPDVDSVQLKIREDALKRVLLVETDIGIAVAILYSDDELAYDGHTGTVAGEFLVGHLSLSE